MSKYLITHRASFTNAQTFFFRLDQNDASCGGVPQSLWKADTIFSRFVDYPVYGVE